MKIENLKPKIYKYSKMVVVLLMVGGLVGIYFIQAQQFAESTNLNEKKLLDLLVPTMIRDLNWLALCLFALGWILWEFTISKMGNKKLGISAIIIIFCSTFFSMNLITYIFAFLSILLMIGLTIVYVPWISERSGTKTIQLSFKANKKLNARFRELLSFRKPKNLNKFK